MLWWGSRDQYPQCPPGLSPGPASSPEWATASLMGFPSVSATSLSRAGKGRVAEEPCVLPWDSGFPLAPRSAWFSFHAGRAPWDRSMCASVFVCSQWAESLVGQKLVYNFVKMEEE